MALKRQPCLIQTARVWTKQQLETGIERRSGLLFARPGSSQQPWNRPGTPGVCAWTHLAGAAASRWPLYSWCSCVQPNPSAAATPATTQNGGCTITAALTRPSTSPSLKVPISKLLVSSPPAPGSSPSALGLQEPPHSVPGSLSRSAEDTNTHIEHLNRCIEGLLRCHTFKKCYFRIVLLQKVNPNELSNDLKSSRQPLFPRYYRSVFLFWHQTDINLRLKHRLNGASSAPLAQFETHEKGKQLATNVIKRQKQPLEHPDIHHYQASVNEFCNYKPG